MTEKDLRLIKEAVYYAERGQDEPIDALLPQTETEEARLHLIELSWQAFKRNEIKSFDL